MTKTTAPIYSWYYLIDDDIVQRGDEFTISPTMSYWEPSRTAIGKKYGDHRKGIDISVYYKVRRRVLATTPKGNRIV